MAYIPAPFTFKPRVCKLYQYWVLEMPNEAIYCDTWKQAIGELVRRQKSVAVFGRVIG